MYAQYKLEQLSMHPYVHNYEKYQTFRKPNRRREFAKAGLNTHLNKKSNS